LSNEKCREALIKIDETALDPDNLCKLIELIKPIYTDSKKEDKINACNFNINALKTFKGDMKLIGITEKFQFMILNFQNMERKIKLLTFKHEYNSIHNETSYKIDALRLS